jgi:hypothetical protein
LSIAERFEGAKVSPEEGADTSRHCDELVAHFEKLIWRSSGFSVVGVVDSCGLDVSDVDFYEKVSELEAYEGLKVAQFLTF